MNFTKLKDWFKRHRSRENPSAGPSNASPPVKGSPGADTLAGSRTADKRTPASEASAATPAPAAGDDESRPLSRKGIPILKPDEDLTACFADEPPNGSDRGAGAELRGREDRPPMPPRSRRPRNLPPRRNRAGIRRLDEDTDLEAYFLAADADTPESADPAPPPGDAPPAAATSGLPTDRHGIPRLDDAANLQRLFGSEPPTAEEGAELGEALRRSLAHDARTLMKKKTGGIFPSRRLSLKEKLRRYPAPQAQLDLHGATAIQARRRGDSFIRNARADGLLTVRLIVGKGLHSEGGAVLPDVIEDVLMALKRQDLVLSYRWEKRIKRKSGAVIAFLTNDLF